MMTPGAVSRGIQAERCKGPGWTELSRPGSSHPFGDAAPCVSQNHTQNGRGWKGPLWVTQPNPLPKQGHLQQAAQDHVQAGLEYLQRRRLHNLPELQSRHSRDGHGKLWQRKPPAHHQLKSRRVF